MDIEVICTGDEVLTGKIINSNFAYISQKLEDFGLSVCRGVTVGDDRGELLNAFRVAGSRAEIVIVNGGLGPTIDDLTQEVAATAAGVQLVLNESWVERMREYFEARGRVMSDNNFKQAMLPAGSEMINNPIGTACGFSVKIGQAAFFFTPGVPVELRRMIEDEILPRILKISGERETILMKRFHTFGLAESRVDQMLAGLEEMVPDGSLKVGFRTHFPQLETKMTIRASSEKEAGDKLEPIIAEVRRRLGNHLISEDNQKLEEVVMEGLKDKRATLSIVETFTGGRIASRLAALPDAEDILLRGIVAPNLKNLAEAFGIPNPPENDGNKIEDNKDRERNEDLWNDFAAEISERGRLTVGASLGMGVICRFTPGIAGNLDGSVRVALATGEDPVIRHSKLSGNRDWIRLGTVELALDSLRRYLLGLPFDEAGDKKIPADNN